MQVEEAPSGRNKDAESKHDVLRRHHLRLGGHRQSLCARPRRDVCVSLLASPEEVTHTASVGRGARGSAAISVELIP